MCYNKNMENEKVKKGKLIYVNDVPNEFEHLKKYIRGSIKDCFGNFDFDCNIRIKFIESYCINKFEVSDCFLQSKSIDYHTISITNNCLKTIKFDGGDFFVTAIFHEMLHIYDYIKMIKTGLFDFNLSLVAHSSFENEYIATGFNFWTEIYAYMMTIKFTQENNIFYEAITFGNLVNKYKIVRKTNKQIENKTDLTYEQAKFYIDCVKSFVYLCSKFMASFYAGHSKLPRKKIDNNKDYEKVYLILKKLEPKVEKLINNAYSKKADVYLFNLGKCIWTQINWKIFHIGLTEKNGKICPFY